jgi:hypothetical protein
MPNILPGDVHVNRELTTVAISFKQQSDENFVADKIFPNVPVNHATDYFYKFGRRAFMQTQAAKRAPSTETPAVEWTFTKDTYSCDVWGLHHDIEDILRANADSIFELDKAGTELVTEQMLLRREKEFLSTFFVSTPWAENVVGVASGPTGTQFVRFDLAGSSPMATFRKAILRFRQRTGMKPNFVLMGAEVWDALIDHPEIVERVKYTQTGILTEALVAKAIGVDNVYVSYGVESANSDEELVADMNPGATFLAGKSMLLGYSAARPSRSTPSAGYTFSWKGYAGAAAWGGRIKKYRKEEYASDRIEIEAAYDMKVTAPELGTFFSTVVS